MPSGLVTTIRGLCDALAEMDWADRRTAHHEAQRLLDTVPEPRRLLADAISSVSPEDIVARSVEKTTHFKWWIASVCECPVAVYLHTYKPPAQLRTGHAVVAHTHRFWFTSLVLRGGFDSCLFSIVRRGPGSSAQLHAERTITLHAGDTYVSDPDEIHAVRHLESRTMTLLVQSDATRSFSDVYENGEVVRYRDLATELDALRAELGADGGRSALATSKCAPSAQVR